jgi:uncharacterized protein YceH (UPF0502 family)
MHLEEHEVRRALNALESQSLVRSVGDSRVTKFEHRLQDAFNFTAQSCHRMRTAFARAANSWRVA